jgi:hypothetical protein
VHPSNIAASPVGPHDPAPATDRRRKLMGLHPVPVSLAQARAAVTAWHRHHGPPVGHKFSVGVATATGTVVGVAIIGRPVARLLDDSWTLEVTRVATDGTYNACSLLYATAWRAGRALGSQRMITYTQAGETGASLRAAGWQLATDLPASPAGIAPSRSRTSHGVDHIARRRWHAPQPSRPHRTNRPRAADAARHRQGPRASALVAQEPNAGGCTKQPSAAQSPAAPQYRQDASP